MTNTERAEIAAIVEAAWRADARRQAMDAIKIAQNVQGVKIR